MSENNHLPYRLGVGLVIFQSDKKIFTGRRLDNTSAWQMPQGGMDENEVPLETAYREMFEETGISKDKVSLVGITKKWYRYDLPSEIQSRFWGGKYRGQSQKWFLFEFIGEDTDINISSKTPEFCEWRWSSIDDLIEKIVPFKMELYKKVLEEFKHQLKIP
jgi:putative (di)nucleoside polyphosphate hydrolase